MRYLAILAALPLSACAMSAGGLARTAVDQSYTSAKAPQIVATCVVESLNGNNVIRNNGDHYWVLRMNGYGVPQTRWDFLPSGSGTRVELRMAIPIASGDEKVRACL
jgi:hypothetical protein